MPDNELFRKVVQEIGVAIIGQTAQLAPADKRFYSIRDVTATVESVAMITGSILSKKLSAGLDALVMDVKVGSGAFMPTYDKSVELAESIVAVGNGAGMQTSAILTDMNESLAPYAGNALEVRGAMDYLTGRSRPARLHEVTLALCAEMLVLGGLAATEEEARVQLEAVLASGAAAERFARMVSALGGPADLIENPDQHLERAPFVVPAPALVGRLCPCARLPRHRPGRGVAGWWPPPSDRRDRLCRRPERTGRPGRAGRRWPASGDGARAHGSGGAAGREGNPGGV